MSKVEEVEARIAEVLRKPLLELDVLREGFECAVRLHQGEKDRKMKHGANFEKSWKPAICSIRVTFEVRPDKSRTAELVEASPVSVQSERLDQSIALLSDLLQALDRAEKRPGYDFISLKWFRDQWLTREGFDWASDDAARSNLLADAIERRLILTSKVPNPKAPQFPVTAIRLNRSAQEVRKALGLKDRDEPLSDFRPVSIRGESLSAMVQRDRR